MASDLGNLDDNLTPPSLIRWLHLGIPQVHILSVPVGSTLGSLAGCPPFFHIVLDIFNVTATFLSFSLSHVLAIREFDDPRRVYLFAASSFYRMIESSDLLILSGPCQCLRYAAR